MKRYGKNAAGFDAKRAEYYNNRGVAITVGG